MLLLYVYLSSRSPVAELRSKIYASILALLGLFLRGSTSLFLSPHATTTLLAVSGCYLYRDVWPYMTYVGMPPEDADDGTWLWVKVSLALCTAVVFPVLQPYPYIPVDQKVRLSRPLFDFLLPYTIGSASVCEPRANSIALFVAFLWIFGFSHIQGISYAAPAHRRVSTDGRLRLRKEPHCAQFQVHGSIYG
jgi:hypothetical protein